MSKYTIDLSYEITDQIVVDQLRDTWERLKLDIGANNHVFVWGDQEADDAEIQKHIDALSGSNTVVMVALGANIKILFKLRAVQRRATLGTFTPQTFWNLTGF